MVRPYCCSSACRSWVVLPSSSPVSAKAATRCCAGKKPSSSATGSSPSTLPSRMRSSSGSGLYCTASRTGSPAGAPGGSITQTASAMPNRYTPSVQENALQNGCFNALTSWRAVWAQRPGIMRPGSDAGAPPARGRTSPWRDRAAQRGSHRPKALPTNRCRWLP